MFNYNTMFLYFSRMYPIYNGAQKHKSSLREVEDINIKCYNKTSKKN